MRGRGVPFNRVGVSDRGAAVAEAMRRGNELADEAMSAVEQEPEEARRRFMEVCVGSSAERT